MKTLTWNCDHCNQLIADKKGYIAVSYADIDRYEEEVPKWETKHAEPISPGSALVFISAAAYREYPPAAQWQTTHQECDLNPDSHDYWMKVERLRTYERLLEFTAHIMEKKWIKSTNWPEFLRRTLSANRKANHDHC